jgi:hypothetical protein
MQEYDAVLVTEEFISPEEFIKRKNEGRISPEKTTISAPTQEMPFGSFKIKLDTPRYAVLLDGKSKRVSK